MRLAYVRCRRFIAATLLLAAAMPAVAPAATEMMLSGAIASGYCGGSNAFAFSDTLFGLAAPCALRPGAIVLEAVYLQNASEVGGTALAAYPLVRMRAGVLPRLQLVVDAPSAIAQSRPGGGGAFPVTHAGAGLSYTVAESSHAATALIATVMPPDSRFAAEHAQSRYQVGLNSNYALSPKWTLGASTTATSSARSGFAMVLPSLDATAAYSPGTRTQVQMGIGARVVTRRAVPQAFADASVSRTISRTLLVTVGLGTTFNDVNNTKPHYLASGFTYRP